MRGPVGTIERKGRPVLVRMTTHITGYRDGVEWPLIGGAIDLPDHEAADLFVAGYAVAGELDESEEDPSAEPVDTGAEPSEADGSDDSAADTDAPSAEAESDWAAGDEGSPAVEPVVDPRYTALGGPWYVLADGTKIRGRAALDAALAEG